MHRTPTAPTSAVAARTQRQNCRKCWTATLRCFRSVLLEMRETKSSTAFDWTNISSHDLVKRKESDIWKFWASTMHWIPFHWRRHLKVGKNFYANLGTATVLDCAMIASGDNCLLAPHVVISSTGHLSMNAKRRYGDRIRQAIVIGNNGVEPKRHHLPGLHWQRCCH
jgi:hypothetical protein